MYINKLNTKDKIRLQLVFLVVLIIGAGWFAYVLPKRQINTLKSKMNTIDEKIARGRDITVNLDHLQQEYNRKQKLLPLMQKILPADAQTTEFLAQVLHSARGLNIDFLRIGKPEIVESQNPADVLQRLKLELSLRGDFPEFINYLDNLRRIHRLFDITKLQVQLVEDIAPEIKVDLTIETYVAPERDA